MNDCSDPPVLEALTFPVNLSSSNTAQDSTELSKETTCLLCQNTYDVVHNRDEFLRHLVVEHKLVIADFKLIADMVR